MWGWFPREAQDRLAHIASVAQFLPALLMAFVPLRDRRALLAACLVVVLGFIQFGKVFSPQWIVWVAPLAILAGTASRWALPLLVLADALTYLQTPVFFYEFVDNPEYTATSPGLRLASTLRIVGLALFWAWSLWLFLRTVGRPEPAEAPR